jgi:hypothetical protein
MKTWASLAYGSAVVRARRLLLGPGVERPLSCGAAGVLLDGVLAWSWSRRQLVQLSVVALPPLVG